MRRRSFLSGSLATVGILVTGISVQAPCLRQIQVYTKGEKWVLTPWQDLKKGMVFRLLEPDGTVADMGTEHEVSIAVKDAAAEDAPACWGVQCEPFTYVKMDHPLAARVQVLHLGEPVGFIQEIDMTMSKGWAHYPGGRIRLERFDEIQVDLTNYQYA